MPVRNTRNTRKTTGTGPSLAEAAALSTGVTPTEECALVATNSRPETMLDIANVVTKALIFSRAMTNPFARPTTRPTSRPSGIASRSPPPATAITEPTTEAAAPVEPIERSNPPAIIMTAIPHATIPMIEFCSRMLMRL